MTVLFMLAPRCSLPVSSQVDSSFHMEILPSLSMCFHPCQAPGTGAEFSQRSGPLAGGSECPLVTWESEVAAPALGTLCADPHQSAWLPFPLALWLCIEIKPMKDPTVDSHACHRAKSGDPSCAGHPSLPRCRAEDVTAGALSRLRFRGSSALRVALVTTGGCVLCLRKLGSSQEVFLGAGVAAVPCAGWDATVGRRLGLGRTLNRMRAGVASLGWM